MTESDESPAPRKTRRLPVAVAWITIVSLTTWIVSLQFTRPQEAEDPVGADSGDSLELVMLEIQSKYLVGVSEWFGDAATGQIEDQLQSLPAAEADQQLRNAIVLGEIAGPESALQQLDQIRSELDDEEQAELAPTLQTLQDLYADYRDEDWEASSVHDAQRQQLADDMGWFGQLALSPKDGVDSAGRTQAVDAAKRIVFGMLTVATAWVMISLLGMAVLIFISVRLLTRKVSPFISRPNHGAVYVEAFAIWMVAYVVLGLVMGLIIPEKFAMLGHLLAMGLSFSVAAWPLKRGVPWTELRRDLGWTRGRGIIWEVLAGMACYTTALPLIVFAFLTTAIVMSLFGEGFDLDHSSAHPIVRQQLGASLWKAVQMFLLASVMAPLLEETMFRGFLYRHLREASSKLPLVLSVAISTLISATVFALIHPQGLLALPAIGAIAVAFALTREWRDSLIAPVIGHGINNTVTLSILFFLFGS